uniref:hypothetical protein n=1 Tax=uncultured Sphingomonas sp. TaxID=158754 RepID=UPI0035CC701B
MLLKKRYPAPTMVPVDLNKRLKLADGKAGGSGDVWVSAAAMAEAALDQLTPFTGMGVNSGFYQNLPPAACRLPHASPPDGFASSFRRFAARISLLETALFQIRRAGRLDGQTSGLSGRASTVSYLFDRGQCTLSHTRKGTVVVGAKGDPTDRHGLEFAFHGGRDTLNHFLA